MNHNETTRWGEIISDPAEWHRIAGDTPNRTGYVSRSEPGGERRFKPGQGCEEARLVALKTRAAQPSPRRTPEPTDDTPGTDRPDVGPSMATINGMVGMRHHKSAAPLSTCSAPVESDFVAVMRCAGLEREARAIEAQIAQSSTPLMPESSDAADFRELQERIKDRARSVIDRVNGREDDGAEDDETAYASVMRRVRETP